MSEPAKLSTHLHRLEARAILEQEYGESDVEDVLYIYDSVVKHIGFEDKRRDKRFIVKFHDIFTVTPTMPSEEFFDKMFDAFCSQQYDNYMEEMHTLGVNVNNVLQPNTIGHYRAFPLDIPHITEENTIDIAREVHDRWLGLHYVDDYVAMVEAMQAMEDSYLNDWLQYVKDFEGIQGISHKTIKTIEKNITKLRERRK